MNNPKLLTLATIILWSFGPFLGRLISFKSQFVLLCLSFSFTFLTMLIFTYSSSKREFFEKIKSISIQYLLIGLCGYYIYWLSFIQSFRAFNSGSEATVLNYTWPIFTIFLQNYFLGIRTEKGK